MTDFEQQPILLQLLPVRRDDRLELNAGAIVQSASQGRIGGTVIDISEHGCRLVLDVERMRPHQQVSIDLPPLNAVSGQVRWVNGSTVGVEFSHSLHWAVVERLRKKRFTIQFDIESYP